MKLTALNVETWKPSTTRQEILDRDGLYFIVQPSGVKSWALRYRRKTGDRKAVKHTIGSYPAVSLKDARSEATRLRAEIERGADPHNDKIAAREKRANGIDTFEAVARRYIEDHQFRRNRSWEWTARLLGFAVDPEATVGAKECPPLLVTKDGSRDKWGRRRLSLVDRWGKRRITDINDADILALLDGISGRTPILANRLHSVLHRLFAWARSRKLITANPIGDIERPAAEQSRDRILDDKELRKVWNAAGELGHPWTGILKLLILSGQRRSEISDLRWSEIDLDERVIHLPAARTKNGQPHDVPLSKPAQAIIAKLPGIVDAELVFTIKRQPITGFSRMKERLDAASGVTDWTLHDLRRTVASGLQKLGVRLEVTEAVLNHKSGSMAGIVGVYQRHDYAAEKRDALTRWAEYVDALAGGRKANIVSLRA
jgi:integrase